MAIVRELEGSSFDGFVKSPSAALRFTFVAAAYIASTPHSSGFARLASGAFYFAILWATFYEIISFSSHRWKESMERTSQINGSSGTTSPRLAQRPGSLGGSLGITRRVPLRWIGRGLTGSRCSGGSSAISPLKTPFPAGSSGNPRQGHPGPG